MMDSWSQSGWRDLHQAAEALICDNAPHGFSPEDPPCFANEEMRFPKEWCGYCHHLHLIVYSSLPMVSTGDTTKILKLFLGIDFENQEEAMYHDYALRAKSYFLRINNANCD